jgi:hypothetical protein
LLDARTQMMLEIMDDYEQQKLAAIKKDNKKIGDPI